jgi:phenylpropionate dioxygenase-like ring-hydroxylating dioxygenase large terminal subunit
MSRRRFLAEPYGAYRQALRPPPDDYLTRVGPGTPAGEYLRRFWHPVAHSAMLKDLPLAIRILGEDLVIFRDRSQRIGLLHRHCAHRGTSLEFGKIETRGIRCCYHGWQFDVDGALIDTPAEPDGNPYRGKLHQGAYPTVEDSGLVFAYLGPPEKRPPFRRFASYDAPGARLELAEHIGGNIKPCNWLQIMDNVADPVHEAYLHAQISGPQFLNDDGEPLVALGIPGKDDYWESPNGVLCNEARRVGSFVWVRSLEYMCPNVIQLCKAPHFPLEESNSDEWETPTVLTRWRVPIDDEHTIEFGYIYVYAGDARPYFNKVWPADLSNAGGRPYETMQRDPGDYEAQVSQGPITRHATEHLATSDRGLALMRRMVREGIEAVARGEDPRALGRDGRPLKVAARETVWRIPEAATPPDDEALMRRLSRTVAERSLGPLPA